MGKLKSRKFWVWITFTIVVIYSIIITNSVSAELVSWWGAVSMIYIGGNVTQKFLERKGP